MSATLVFPPGEYVVTELRPIGPPGPPPPTAVAAGEDGPEWIDVTDYGAVGDGETDDTEAINAAIDVLNGRA